ncbi:hypothetical protein L2E82_35864 [Cichorium intybus]|uniref:Uncharacterized protein n=1 Tax=Cichorium intybus TaxID=13427 RepID=A0ACB9BQ25_CICIN|nr:hypothetical protein L2E82_35864 [Cichorium intybus]
MFDSSSRSFAGLLKISEDTFPWSPHRSSLITESGLDYSSEGVPDTLDMIFDEDKHLEDGELRFPVQS